jgi:hypothetical protein
MTRAKHQDPAQLAWEAYIKTHLPHRDSILEAHRSFLAGFSKGSEYAQEDEQRLPVPDRGVQ